MDDFTAEVFYLFSLLVKI